MEPINSSWERLTAVFWWNLTHSRVVVSAIAQPKHNKGSLGESSRFCCVFFLFKSLFGFKMHALPVRITVQLSCRLSAVQLKKKKSLLLSCTTLWEQAIIKSICVAVAVWSLALFLAVEKGEGSEWKQRSVRYITFPQLVIQYVWIYIPL